MNIFWNNKQDGLSQMTTYTLIHEDTNEISFFVFDKELENPVLVQHFNLDDEEYSNDLEYVAFVELAKWLANYLEHYSEVHPALLLRNWDTAFCTLNFFALGDGCIKTVNINLNTFVKLGEMWNPDFWYLSNCESFFHTILNFCFEYVEVYDITENQTILNKVDSIQEDAAKPGFFNRNPDFDITKPNKL